MGFLKTTLYANYDRRTEKQLIGARSTKQAQLGRMRQRAIQLNHVLSFCRSVIKGQNLSLQPHMSMIIFPDWAGIK